MKTYKLGEVCLVSKGKTITRATTTEGQVPVIGGGLGPTYFHNLANRKPPVITISASGANAGFVNYWGLPIWASDCTTISEKSDSPASIGYIYKYLQSRQEFINTELRRGSAQPHVYPSDIAELQIPLPSLEKQRQIVEKLDSVFAEIESLEGNLELCGERADQLFQSILSTSFAHSAGTAESSKSLLHQDISRKLVKLVDVCKLVGGGTPSKANLNFYLGEIPWATVRDLHSRWLGETEHRINAVAVRESSTNVIPSGNVVLATRVGLGKVVQLKQDTAINQDLRALIPRDISRIDSNYLYYWALSVTPEIIAAGKGATVQGVTLPFLENLEIPLPSLEMQREIVGKLDSAFAEVKSLKNQIRFRHSSAAELRSSLLSSSFIDVYGVA